MELTRVSGPFIAHIVLIVVLYFLVEKDSTLFSSATDTVISLVKTVLSSDNGDVATDDAASDTGTGDPSDTVTADTLSDAVNLQGDALNASARNVTASRTEQRATEPCAPDVM